MNKKQAFEKFYYNNTYIICTDCEEIDECNSPCKEYDMEAFSAGWDAREGCKWPDDGDVSGSGDGSGDGSGQFMANSEQAFDTWWKIYKLCSVDCSKCGIVRCTDEREIAHIAWQACKYRNRECRRKIEHLLKQQTAREILEIFEKHRRNRFKNDNFYADFYVPFTTEIKQLVGLEE